MIWELDGFPNSFPFFHVTHFGSFLCRWAMALMPCKNSSKKERIDKRKDKKNMRKEIL